MFKCLFVVVVLQLFILGTPPVLGKQSFCGYASFCDATTDMALMAQFQAMGVSDDACAAVIKTIICSRCSPSSGELFDASTSGSTIPLLCNNSNMAGDSYCKLVWQTCKDSTIVDHRSFQPRNSSLHTQESNNITSSESEPSTTTIMSKKFTDLWRSEADFCSSFGGDGSSSSPCFNGQGSSSRLLQAERQPSSSPNEICLERIYSGGSYVAMAAHPDGSGRVFLSSQDGMIWLATMPAPAHGSLEGIDGGAVAAKTPFLDLRDRVHHGGGGLLGFKGIAFHPEFVANGRFFVSYTCDSARSPACGDGRCGAADIGAWGCRYQLVITEFSAKDVTMGMPTSTSDPREVRRIFSMGLPQPQVALVSGFNHGGQIVFSPSNGNLYVITGFGGIQTAAGHIDFSWNERSFLGKIIRLDVNNFPGMTPQQPEMIAMGIGDPKGCSFNPYRRLYCSLVVDAAAEVRLIDMESGNRGSYTVIRHAGGPSTSTTPSSITGGLFYRGSTDHSLEGRYLYMYDSGIWAATETPEGSGRYGSARIAAGCSTSSPMACSPTKYNGIGDGGGGAIAGRVHSIGEDNNRDAFFLATEGVYWVVHPALCRGAAATDPVVVAGAAGDGTNRSPAAAQGKPTWRYVLSAWGGFLACLSIWYSLVKVFGGGGGGGGDGQDGQSPTNCFISCLNNISCC